MRRFTQLAATALAVKAVTAQDEFNVLQHLGGNGQWFPGPEVTGISSDIPSGCTVDLAAFASRHGSRFPDTGAYGEWTDLHDRLQAAPFNVTSEKLAFLQTWKPVLTDPGTQIAQLSPTGIKELQEMGATWRQRYPHLYEENTPLAIWANYYKSGPRVRDSARNFAKGFLGPNASALGKIHALNSSDPASFMNSLATSDLCPAYKDEGGSPFKDEWEALYLPPIRARLNAMITGGFNFTQWDVSIIPYLCGFETQITSQRSPFCDLFTEDEILQYEYAQDLRYWYGAGLGTDIEKYQMLPVLDGLVQRFIDGPNKTYTTSSNTSFTAPNVIAAFSNDGQISQLIAASGVFDNEPDLPGDQILADRKFRASRFVTMRGTIAFERLSCVSNPKPESQSRPTGTTGYKAPSTPKPSQKQTYLRILLNDVVYPVANCASGPGSSCPLSQYQGIVKRKLKSVGSFKQICNVTNEAIRDNDHATFWRDDAVSWGVDVVP